MLLVSVKDVFHLAYKSSSEKIVVVVHSGDQHVLSCTQESEGAPPPIALFRLENSTLHSQIYTADQNRSVSSSKIAPKALT